jgi:hypothetical protein
MRGSCRPEEASESLTTIRIVENWYEDFRDRE